jgi:serine phosphatase RsbU (regulator of sigma subunit)
MADAEFPAAPPVRLDPGDLVLMFTDGITEATTRDGRPFGLERALDVVRAHRHDHPSEITESLFRAVRDFAGRPPSDDITAVVIRA